MIIDVYLSFYYFVTHQSCHVTSCANVYESEHTNRYTNSVTYSNCHKKRAEHEFGDDNILIKVFIWSCALSEWYQGHEGLRTVPGI
jgi:hypothetical protein